MRNADSHIFPLPLFPDTRAQLSLPFKFPHPLFLCHSKTVLTSPSHSEPPLPFPFPLRTLSVKSDQAALHGHACTGHARQ